jgi:TP901 family phage tail tape measure protein
MPNVVEITVSARNATKAGFAEAKATATDAAGAMDEFALAADRAAEAQARLDEASANLARVQGDEKATTAELAAAQDEYAAALDRASGAALASMDAQLRLGKAELDAAGSAKVSGDATAGAAAKGEAAAAGLAGKVQKAGLMAGAALAGVGFEAIKMATNFDAQMTRLGTQAGVPLPKIAGLKAGVLALAGQVGFSPDSLAESLYHVASNMASMGATAPKMLDVVRVAAEGAKTGGADLVDVTNALTAAVASGIPGVQNYRQAMGMLNATVGAGDMKMQDLAEAFGSGMVATVKGFGLSLKDVGAALAVFGDNNIRGAHAGTQLRMSVMALAVPAAAGKKELEGMGLSMTSLATDMRQGGLLKALEDLSTHMHKAGITAKQQGDVITTIFGKKAGAGLNVLMDQLDRLKSKYPDITKGAHDFGKAWETTQGTLKQQLAELRGSFDALMVTIGQKLLPVVQDIVKWMLSHKQVVIDLAIAAGILGGALAAAAIVIKTVKIATEAWTIATQAWAIAGKLAAAAQWLLNVAMSANPIGLIVIAIAGLVVVIYEMAKHFAWFRDFWKAVWKDITHLVSDAVGFIKTHWQLILAILTGPVGLAVLFIKDHWREIVRETERLWHDVVRFFTAVWHDVVKIATTLWDDLVNGFKQLGHDIVAAVTDLWHREVTGWETIWHDVVKVAKSLWDDLVNGFRKLPGLILSALGDTGKMLWNAGVSIVKGLIGGITSMFGAVGNVASSLAHKIAGFFGLSPAKEGPLSAGGAPEVRGRHFTEDFAAGMLAGLPRLSSAVTRVAGAAGTGGGYGAGPYGPGYGGVLYLEMSVAPGTPPGLAAELLKTIRFMVRTQGGGDVQAAFGRVP